MNTEKIRNWFQSKQCKSVIAVFLIAIAILFIFNLGMRVGYLKASFINRSGDNYYRPLVGAAGEHVAGFIQNVEEGVHGVTGKIVSIDLKDGTPTIVVADRDTTEKVVRMGAGTIIRKIRETISPNDLKAGDIVVVIGEPDTDDAEIEARLIRVMPQMPLSIPSPTNTQ